VLVVHPSVPAKSLAELVALIKSQPDKLTYSSGGFGTPAHLAGELFKATYGVDIIHVPFTGGGPAMNSTIGGHTPIAFTALPPAMTNIREGKLRGLAVLSTKRSPALPDVPTNVEAGVAGLESDTLTGIVAPAGTPKEIIDRWREDIVKLVAMPEVRQRLETLGFAPVANTPHDFGERIKTEIAKWGKVVRDASIRAD
jgi:tripartite-type tricarboxylate transporter receptor subunit TctC